jgi:hypothetical protein
MMKNKLQLFQWAVGACDASTGILLVAAPAWTLHLMGMTKILSPPDIISFVGVFVMAVGLSYFLVKEKDVAGWEMQWRVTAMIRVCVACFLAWKIAGEGWEVRWLTVLITDATIATIQVLGLKRGWLRTMN